LENFSAPQPKGSCPQPGAGSPPVLHRCIHSRAVSEAVSYERWHPAGFSWLTLRHRPRECSETCCFGPFALPRRRGRAGRQHPGATLSQSATRTGPPHCARTVGSRSPNPNVVRTMRFVDGEKVDGEKVDGEESSSSRGTLQRLVRRWLAEVPKSNHERTIAGRTARTSSGCRARRSRRRSRASALRRPGGSTRADSTGATRHHRQPT
jgi:hypothetical protein